MKTFEIPLNPIFEFYNSSGISTYSLMKFLDDRNTFVLSINFKVKLKPVEVFNYMKQFMEEGFKFNFLNDSFFMVDDNMMITVAYDTFGKRENLAGQYYVKINSFNLEKITSIKEEVDQYMEAFSVNSVVWAIMAPNGEIIYKEMDVSRKFHEATTEFYPWLNGIDLQDYFKSYLASEENILLLVGDPGTGKTTFIKNLLIKQNLNAVITYDEKLMKDDSFFLDFITGDKDVLIIEDADTMIYDREKEDNSIMSKILNVSDGIIKNVDKKIIFSTNITDINRIDSALMRPGRCYDTLDFRKLTHEEATAILKIQKREKVLDPMKKLYTLAEVLSNTNRNQHQNKHKVGF